MAAGKTDDGEVMMPMTKPDALQHIEITVLRQLGENIAAQTRHLETLNKSVEDVRERVIRIEAKETEKQVEELKKRVADLEVARNQIDGVRSFGKWLIEAAPWMMTAVVIVAAVLGFGKK